MSETRLATHEGEGGRLSRWWTLFVLVSGLALPSSVFAQQAERINFYRYVLDIEVPESPVLVALDLAPTHAFRATSPKPIGANLLASLREDGSAAPAAALEVSPYFLAGGGIRPVENWRSTSLGGRLMRVLTKTVLSLGATGDPLEAEALRAAVALRSTLHDTHDPIGNTELPERLSDALEGAGGGPPPLDVEDIDKGAEVRRLLREAAREMRGRQGWLLSAGLGVAGTLGSGVVSEDSIASEDWTVWLDWQYTFGPRFDLLVTGRVLRLFDPDADFRLASGLQRKTVAADFLAELFFDTADDRLHVGFAAETSLAPRLGSVVSIGTEPGRGETATERQLELRALLRWYMAQGGG